MKTPSLRFEMMQIGKRSSTDVCMVYMSDRASSDAVDRLRKQLKGIKLDTVLTSGYIEPLSTKASVRQCFHKWLIPKDLI